MFDSNKKCDTVSYSGRCQFKNHSEEGSPTQGCLTVWCYSHHQNIASCAYDWQLIALEKLNNDEWRRLSKILLWMHGP